MRKFLAGILVALVLLGTYLFASARLDPPVEVPAEFLRVVDERLKFTIAEKESELELAERLLKETEESLSMTSAELTRYIRALEKAEGKTRWVEVPVEVEKRVVDRASCNLVKRKLAQCLDQSCPLCEVDEMALQAEARAYRLEVEGRQDIRYRLDAKANARWSIAGRDYEATSGWQQAEELDVRVAAEGSREARFRRDLWLGVGRALDTGLWGPSASISLQGRRYGASVGVTALIWDAGDGVAVDDFKVEPENDWVARVEFGRRF